MDKLRALTYFVACAEEGSFAGAARKLEDLPTSARKYLDRIEELSGAPIRYVSVGTRRDQIIGL